MQSERRICGPSGLRRLLLLFLIACSLASGFSPIIAEEYQFDISEVEKKPYHIGGYVEFFPAMFGLDKNAALYKLNFYNRNEGSTTELYSGTLQLEGGFERGISRLYFKTHTNYTNSYSDETTKTTLFEGYLSVKPSSSVAVELGKKTLNWGKGYAWNPVAFLDRPKNPDDPELSREGYVVASLDYTKSFEGPLKTFSFTPVIMPVYSGLNDDFGKVHHVNVASKLYFLFYNTDIDFMFLAGGSRTTRFGVDFSRNVTTNLEIHGEFSYINDFKTVRADDTGNSQTATYDAKNYLIGLRYLSARDTTYILEYYRNGTGFSGQELESYFSFVDRGYDVYSATGNTTLLNRAAMFSRGGYGTLNPARKYLYLRISQKDPFDVLYFTPAVTVISNIADRSFTFTPELTYTGITNLELRLRTAVIAGAKNSEYGEKPNDWRIDLRARYYF